MSRSHNPRKLPPKRKGKTAESDEMRELMQRELMELREHMAKLVTVIEPSESHRWFNAKSRDEGIWDIQQYLWISRYALQVHHHALEMAVLGNKYLIVRSEQSTTSIVNKIWKIVRDRNKDNPARRIVDEEIEQLELGL